MLDSAQVGNINCQARVQVPNPLSQQAPNPDSKVSLSLKNPKTQFNKSYMFKKKFIN